MDDNLSLLGSPSSDGGGGGGVPSDGSITGGSILTSFNNQEKGISSEVSSPFPNENLELGLGLSIGGGGSCGGGGLKSKPTSIGWGQYARILTAKDFPSLISDPNPNSSSPIKNLNLSTFDAKRIANDSVSGSTSSVVGWPPIRRGYRLANQTKSPDEQSSSTAEGNGIGIGNNLSSKVKDGVSNKGYQPVKVNMDGTLIGRKVDLNAHNSYATLAQTLEDMFCHKRSSTEATGPSKLLDETSEYVLTYEDKDGDFMLVGDVPWRMFLSSVKRLRIMRNSESNELRNHKRGAVTPTSQEKNSRQRTDNI